MSRFRGILVKTIRDAGSKFDDYSITPKIRQILLQQDYKLTEKTLTFNNIRLNKKKIHKSKEPIELMSVIVDQIVVSDKFKHNNEVFKYFIGYQKGGIVKPLYVILPQVSGYIK